jgi:hypothetical protein
MPDRKTTHQSDEACMTVAPGVCGFTCLIRGKKIGKRRVAIRIENSECGQIKHLSGQLDALTLKELFMPLTRNPVYTAAEKSGCHASCAIPSAVLKTVEVAMGMAVAKEVIFRFDCNGKG